MTTQHCKQEYVTVVRSVGSRKFTHGARASQCNIEGAKLLSLGCVALCGPYQRCDVRPTYHPKNNRARQDEEDDVDDVAGDPILKGGDTSKDLLVPNLSHPLHNTDLADARCYERKRDNGEEANNKTVHCFVVGVFKRVVAERRPRKQEFSLGRLETKSLTRTSFGQRCTRSPAMSLDIRRFVTLPCEDGIPNSCALLRYAI